jgi:hydroxyacylglutathione hydrolase
VRVVPVPQLADNYAYLVIDEGAGICGVVDVAEAGPVLSAAKNAGSRIVAILSTHHHFDHVNGNEDLIAALPEGSVEVYGFAEDRDRIPGITRGLADGESFRLGSLDVAAIFIPAHTRGHLAYHFPAERVVFTGDTMFAGGCGRLFEGDARQMMASLDRLARLPGDTRVYCGHEYTAKNLEFAAMLEPSNAALAGRRREVAALLAAGKPTVPTTIAIEKETNPFLRATSAELAASVRAKDPGAGGDPESIFAATRRLKDNY